MPTINVSERAVSPKLDQGLYAGLIAGVVGYIWLLLVGALSSGGAAGTFITLAAFAVGDNAYDAAGKHADWLVGTITYFIIFAILGIIFALAWPRLRKFGTWVPSILYGLGSYVVVIQIIGRIAQPEMPGHLHHFALISAFFLAGLVFAYRYRRA